MWDTRKELRQEIENQRSFKENYMKDARELGEKLKAKEVIIKAKDAEINELKRLTAPVHKYHIRSTDSGSHLTDVVAANCRWHGGIFTCNNREGAVIFMTMEKVSLERIDEGE